MANRTKFICLFGLLTGLVLLGIESVQLGLYHEEPTRLLVSSEMFQKGSWFVPHRLGEFYFKKPPGFNWWVIFFSFPFGGVTALTARVSVIACWLLLGAAAGLYNVNSGSTSFQWYQAFATLFIPVIFVEKAALAELDLFFSFVLFLALFCWFRLHESNREMSAWVVSHLFLLLGLLTKGPVAYVFFYGPIFVYLYWTGFQFSGKKFLVGLFTAHVPLMLWLLRIIEVVSLKTFSSLVMAELFQRGSWGNPLLYGGNFFKFPVWSFFSLFPWVIVLTVFFDTEIRERYRNRLTNGRRFILSAITPFFLFWVFPVSSTRYILPVFPWVGVLTGDILTVFHRLKEVQNRLKLAGYSIAGLLIITLVSPWVLNTSPIISFREQLTVAVLIAAAGLLVLGWLLTGDLPVEKYVVLFVLSLIVFKFGFFGLYLPSEKAEYFIHRKQSIQVGDELKSEGIKDVLYRSKSLLGLPYYLLKSGIDVRNTSKVVVPEDQGTALMTLKPLRQTPVLSLMDQFDFYGYRDVYVWVRSPETPEEKTSDSNNE